MTWKKWRNVFITFIACGIWHGSSFHFILWGAYHGLLNNLTSKRNNYRKTITHFITWLITLFLVLFGWLLFRADSIKYVISFMKRIITQFSLSYTSITGTVLPFTGDNTAIAYAITLFVMIVLLFIKEVCDENRDKSNTREESNSNYTLFWTSLFLVMIILFGITGSSNFLYANF